MKYYYVDTGELREFPREGPQWTAWYVGSSMNNPSGREFIDVIKGQECVMRAMTEKVLADFLKSAYSRAPYVKPRPIVGKGDE
jgi:hypothetical protein